MYNNEIINLAQRETYALIRQKRDEAIAKRTERKIEGPFRLASFNLIQS